MGQLLARERDALCSYTGCYFWKHTVFIWTDVHPHPARPAYVPRHKNRTGGGADPAVSYLRARIQAAEGQQQQEHPGPAGEGAGAAGGGLILQVLQGPDLVQREHGVPVGAVASACEELVRHVLGQGLLQGGVNDHAQLVQVVGRGQRDAALLHPIDLDHLPVGAEVHELVRELRGVVLAQPDDPVQERVDPELAQRRLEVGGHDLPKC